jgi:Protein of unknown function (DUF2510)
MDQPDRPAAGWFPDPSGQPGQRYYDGRRWTQHFVPTPPPSAPAPTAVAVAVSSGGGANHALHAVLTFLSCGLWLPIWILVALFDSGRGSSAVVVGGASANAGTPSRLDHKPLVIVGAVFLGLIAIGTGAEHPWVLVLLILLAGAGGAILWKYKTAKDREELALREQYRRDVLADRADYEDKLFYEGDPRGTYGRYMPPESLREQDDR